MLSCAHINELCSYSDDGSGLDVMCSTSWVLRSRPLATFVAATALAESTPWRCCRCCRAGFCSGRVDVLGAAAAMLSPAYRGTAWEGNRQAAPILQPPALPVRTDPRGRPGVQTAINAFQSSATTVFMPPAPALWRSWRWLHLRDGMSDLFRRS